MEYISTGSKVIDNLLDGGWPTKATAGVFSDYDNGKSFLMYQTACHLWKEKGLKTLYIDTESNWIRTDTRKRFTGFFQDRWGFEDDPEIDFIFPDDLKDLGKLVGKELNVVSEPGAKQIQVYINNLEGITTDNCQLAEKMKNGEYGLIVLDSLSLPIKHEIPVPPRQNFPSRASVESAILGRLTPISKKFDSGCVVVLHETRDPAKGHYDTGDFVGGRGVGYDFKYLLQIKGSPKKEKRTVSHFRYPGKQSARTKKQGEEVKLAKNKGYMP